MSENENPSIAAVVEEIRVRAQELETLRAALEVLRSERQPQVHILSGSNGEFMGQLNVFDPTTVGQDNGHGAVAAVVAAAPAIKKEKSNSRASTARLLTFFDRQHARTLEDVAAKAGVPKRMISAGVLTRHGYLKAKGEGYVRTAKDYVP